MGWERNLRILSARIHFALTFFKYGSHEWRKWKCYPRNFIVSTWKRVLFSKVSGRNWVTDLFCVGSGNTKLMGGELFVDVVYCMLEDVRTHHSFGPSRRKEGVRRMKLTTFQTSHYCHHLCLSTSVIVITFFVTRDAVAPHDIRTSWSIFCIPEWMVTLTYLVSTTHNLVFCALG